MVSDASLDRRVVVHGGKLASGGCWAYGRRKLDAPMQDYCQPEAVWVGCLGRGTGTRRIQRDGHDDYQSAKGEECSAINQSMGDLGFGAGGGVGRSDLGHDALDGEGCRAVEQKHGLSTVYKGKRGII